MAPALTFQLIVLFAAVMIGGCATAVEKVDRPAVEKRLTANTRLVTVAGRKGATQPFLALTPPQTHASVILFAGDTGHLAIRDSGAIGNLRGNFLVKIRSYLVQQGMAVALVDTPSDRTTLDGFRAGRAHAEDIRAVIRWLRRQADVPVWLVGTSRGTISAAAIAGHLSTGGPDGIVLTSTLFGPSKRGTVYAADLASIAVPVLVVHHKADACSVTRYKGANAFMKALTGTRTAELFTIEGGAGNIGDPCGPMSPHGFLGLENRVVKAIADWIKAH